MEVIHHSIEGLVEFIPAIWTDSRGHFFESYREDVLVKAGVKVHFVQDNQSFSKKGVLRGLHFQNSPMEQGKLVRVISGSVLDVVVDIRKDSKTYGQHAKFLLEASKGNILWVPPGFAHGFVAIEDVVFFYKCTNYYSKAHEGGLLYNDPELGIDWEQSNPLVSDKDLLLEPISKLHSSF